jgi:hypothetical protein
MQPIGQELLRARHAAVVTVALDRLLAHGRRGTCGPLFDTALAELEIRLSRCDGAGVQQRKAGPGTRHSVNDQGWGQSDGFGLGLGFGFRRVAVVLQAGAEVVDNVLSFPDF